MITHIGLSDERIGAIIRDHEADPDGPPPPHTWRELVQLAREARDRRAADREGRHAERNRLAPFASAVEAVRTLDRRGLLDLSPFPWLRDQVEDCHRGLDAMNRGAATTDTGAVPDPGDTPLTEATP
jgi:hypothetical protein